MGIARKRWQKITAFCAAVGIAVTLSAFGKFDTIIAGFLWAALTTFVTGNIFEHKTYAHIRDPNK